MCIGSVAFLGVFISLSLYIKMFFFYNSKWKVLMTILFFPVIILFWSPFYVFDPFGRLGVVGRLSGVH